MHQKESEIHMMNFLNLFKNFSFLICKMGMRITVILRIKEGLFWDDLKS